MIFLLELFFPLPFLTSTRPIFLTQRVAPFQLDVKREIGKEIVAWSEILRATLHETLIYRHRNVCTRGRESERRDK